MVTATARIYAAFTKPKEPLDRMSPEQAVYK